MAALMLGQQSVGGRDLRPGEMVHPVLLSVLPHTLLGRIPRPSQIPPGRASSLQRGLHFEMSVAVCSRSCTQSSS